MADVSTLYIKIDSSGVVTASKSLSGLSKQSAVTAKSVDGVTASTTRMTNATKLNKVSLAEASSGLKTVGRDLTRYSLLMAGAATAVTKFTFDLSKGMGQVQTLIPQSGDRIYELEQAVKDLAISSGKGFNDLTQGLYQTISAFQDSANTVDIFTQATEAAIAGGATVADSIELASAVTKSFGDTSAEATQKVFDLAFETVRLGQTTFPELANGIQTATDSAVRLGVSQEELFAVFSSLTGVIGDASEVATKFRSASASLLNPNAKLQELFKALGEELGTTITTGTDFVKAAGGIQGALALIVDTALDSDEPLQDYIRRIEGITLSSRLSGASAEKFASDLIAMANSAGAASQSYKEVKDGIDSFRQSILESRQEIAVAATNIGENLVPRLADLLDKVAGAVTSFSLLQAGTQQFIITIGATIAVLGPLLILFGSIARAIKGIQALQLAGIFTPLLTVLGPAGLIGVLAAVVVGFLAFSSAISKNIEEQKRLNEELSSTSGVAGAFNTLALKYDTVNDVTIVNRDLNKELITLYPELADKVDIYNDSLEDVYNEMVKIKQIKLELALQGQIDALQKLRSNAREAADEYAGILPQFRALFEEMGGNKKFTGGFEGFLKAISDGEVEVDNYLGLINRFRIKQAELNKEQSKFADAYDAVKQRIEETGLFNVIADEAEILKLLPKELTDILDEMQQEADKNKPTITLTPDVGDAKKTWQEWFEEITGVAKETFGNSGKLAGELYTSAILDSIGDEAEFAKAFGEVFNPKDVVESKLEEVKSAYRELLSIPEDQIDEFFKKSGINATTTDGAIKELEHTIDMLNASFVRLSTQDVFDVLAKTVEQINLYGSAIPSIVTDTDILSQKLTAEVKAFEALSEIEGVSPNALEAQAKNVELAKQAVEALELQKQQLADTKAAWESLGDSLLNIGMDALADSFTQIGYALGNSAGDLEDFGQAMNNVLKGILDMIPGLMIQAGLSLIIANPTANLGIGLGLIAAGLAGKLVMGLVQGTIDSGEGTTSNANGNAYGTTSFSKGGALGSFENSIVNTPTRFGNGAGLMGEAGAEAIMPLSRTTDGKLGVASVGNNGGGANVSVTIINNSGESVSQKETTRSDGSKEIEIMVGRMINTAIATGKTDSAMASRYGTKIRGYN